MPSPHKTTRKGRSASKEQEKEEDESPRRRSGRRAAKEAEEKIRTDAAVEEASKEDEEEPMETESSAEKATDDKEAADRIKQVKRKHDEIDEGKPGEEKTASPAKKLKSESSVGDDTKSTDESMPNIEEISEESAGEEASKDGSGSSKRTEPMEDAPILEAEPKSGEMMKVAGDASDKLKQMEPVLTVEQKPISLSKETTETKLSEDVKNQTDGQTTTTSGGKSTQYTPDKEQTPSGHEKPSHNLSSSKEALEMTAGTQYVTPSRKESQDPEPLKDYVVINMDDVPAPDSSEVSTSIPQVRITPPDQDNNIDHDKKKEDGSSNTNQTPTEAAPSKTASVSHDTEANSLSSSTVQSASPNNRQSSDCNNVAGAAHCTGDLLNNGSAKKDSQDPLLCRRFLPNPTVDINLVPPEKTFTAVSYNILADCHAQRAHYKWISEEHVSVEYRHQRLMKELKYLDGDIICIQEIGPDHYSKLLQPQLSQ